MICGLPVAKLFKKDSIVLILLLVLFSFYAAVFIYKTSFVIDGVRYFTLFDDAMISMRYARNLIEGHGLVMNPGERVEGYTNPLWVLFMAAVHLLPVPQSKISIIVQITGALLLLPTIVFVRKIALLISGNSSQVSNTAMFLTAFYLPLINWCLQGMEISLQALIMSIAVWRTILSIRTSRIPIEVYFLLGIGTLVRIDMAVPYIGIWLFLIFLKPEQRMKNFLWGGLVFAFFLGSQTLFRMVYYGDPLPNTYYLKMTGYPFFLRITRGFFYWWKFIWNMNLLAFLLPFGVIIFTYTHSRGILALVVGLQMIYSIYVGGDAWEEWGGSNRYIAFVMPEFFILFAYGLSRIKDGIADIGKNACDFHKKAHVLILKYHFVFLLFFSFFLFNDNSGSLTLKGMAMIDLPADVENNKGMVERALLIKQITTPAARIAVTWAGAIPYFSERNIADILGKTDRSIAHGKMRRGVGLKQLIVFLPGHMKFDYKHTVGELQPDAVLQFWGELEEAEPYMLGKYTKLVVKDKFYYLRNGSENILWDKFMKSTQ